MGTMPSTQVADKENVMPISPAHAMKLDPNDKVKTGSAERFTIKLSDAKSQNPPKLRISSPAVDNKQTVTEKLEKANQKKTQLQSEQVARINEHHERIKKSQRQIKDQFEQKQASVEEKLKKKEETVEENLERIRQEKVKAAEENEKRLAEARQ